MLGSLPGPRRKNAGHAMAMTAPATASPESLTAEPSRPATSNAHAAALNAGRAANRG